MKIELSLEDAKDLLSRALNARLGNKHFSVTDVEWRAYRDVVRFDMEEMATPEQAPDYIPITIEPLL
jgi:hypothetical protein